jgi:membrane protease YdiL (CAAX protease family)
MLAFIFLNRSRTPWRANFKSGHSKIYIINAVMGAAAMVFYFLWPLSGIPQDVHPVLQGIGLSEGNYLYLLAYFVLVNPWIEEYFWRGYLGSTSKGITPCDVLFAGYHVMLLATVIGAIWLVPAFVILSSAAWFWRQCDRWSQGLGASILSHITADAAISVVLILMIIR